MDDLVAFLISHVGERADPTMCHQQCTEVNASYVKLKARLENIGVKVDFQASTDVNNTKQMW